MNISPDSLKQDLTAITRFRFSIVLDMLSSLQAAADLERSLEWTRTVEADLGSEFMNRLQDLYAPFHGGCDFVEIAVNFDGDTLDAFFDHFQSLSDRRLVFYLLGQIYPEEAIPEDISSIALRGMLDSTPNQLDPDLHVQFQLDWADDLPHLRRECLLIWREYADAFYREGVDTLRSCWSESIAENRRILDEKGAMELFHLITGLESLPLKLPRTMPYELVEYVPVTRISRPYSMYYGYGRITILFDCSLNESRIQELNQKRDDTIRLLKALAEESRLKILKLIGVADYKYNGRQLAQRLDLSSSVVSRNLKQLKEAGLISEQSPDRRNIYYALNRRALEGLSSELLSLILEV